MRPNGPVMRSWFVAAVSVMALVVSAGLMGCGGGGGGGGGENRWLFRVTDLGTLGGDMSTALALNGSGQVVGWSRLPGTDTYHAFSYADGTMTDLGTLAAGGNSQASDMNNNGVICGTSDVGGNNQRAFRYLNNEMEDIGTVSPWINANAEGINDAGQIVGNSGGAAFLWENGEMRQLPTPDGPGGATAINRNGMVCGWFHVYAESRGHAFRGTLTTATDLGVLSGTSSTAFDINDDGDCAGFYVQGNDRHLFIYRNDTMQNIGTLGGFQGEAHGINNSDIVVGTDWTEDHYLHAFLWDGEMHDLNDLLDASSQGWVLTRAPTTSTRETSSLARA